MDEKDPSHQITRILDRVRSGDDEAVDTLMPAVYLELRRMARGFMARERQGHTLQPTALVHEAYLRLVGREPPEWQNRAHFFSAAAEAMRRILIDQARHRRRLKRGGDMQRTPLHEDAVTSDPEDEELLALDECLSRLERKDPFMATVVKLRHLVGMTVEETAQALDSSPRSVHRAWAAARAWLLRELEE